MLFSVNIFLKPIIWKISAYSINASFLELSVVAASIYKINIVREHFKPQSYDVKNAPILHMFSKNIPLYMTSHIMFCDVHVKRE